MTRLKVEIPNLRNVPIQVVALRDLPVGSQSRRAIAIGVEADRVVADPGSGRTGKMLPGAIKPVIVVGEPGVLSHLFIRSVEPSDFRWHLGRLNPAGSAPGSDDGVLEGMRPEQGSAQTIRPPSRDWDGKLRQTHPQDHVVPMTRGANADASVPMPTQRAALADLATVDVPHELLDRGARQADAVAAADEHSAWVLVLVQVVFVAEGPSLVGVEVATMHDPQQILGKEHRVRVQPADDVRLLLHASHQGARPLEGPECLFDGVVRLVVVGPNPRSALVVRWRVGSHSGEGLSQVDEAVPPELRRSVRGREEDEDAT
eukprot:CAMPEP_0206497676 /NCGR_PEP_ID=MMETSP0324_2-20121206/50396_1 /ASSEMBLY_ACC=CAM_ASM_000836 /TAXON_ID=2866 /ORGANISM="Crypthecodinium cohnii, Strain Seligo" /LENGTH=315 /DNA_ID=CAMNT_0053983429 /DNA_START=701 /DNA_END=1649 /DNA_ORIENTATION=+